MPGRFFFTVVLLFAFCFILPPALHADRVIEVRKSARANPTVSVTGIGGDIGSNIQRFLLVSGWFDAPQNGKVSDYVVRTGFAGGFLSVELLHSGTTVYAWKFNASMPPRELAKVVVDTIIEHIFEQLKVKGFCQSKIAFCAETHPGVRNVFTCDIDGGNMEQITAYNTLNVEPCWSPNGKTICFSKYGRSGIDIVETTVAKPRKSRIVTSFRGINTGAAVSPDGNFMAVILSPDHQVDLYVLGLSRRFQKRMTKGIAVEASPCWSPDGRQLAFVSDRMGNPRIFVINADGSGSRVLPTAGRDAVTPAWSADNKIAYATRPHGSSNYMLAVLDLDSGENKIISKGYGSWESPGWAADNRQVVCKRMLNGKSSLWIVDTKTGRERELLRTGTELFDPAWSPCIKR